MNVYSVLSLISFFIFGQAVIYILWKDHKSKQSRLLALLTFLFAIYAGSYSLLFSASDLQQVYLFDKVASIGWVFFPFITVLFYASFTPNISKVTNIFLYGFLFPVALYSSYFAIFHLDVVKYFYQHQGIWFYTPHENLQYYLFTLYLIVSVLISFFTLINWYYVSESNREKYQAKILIFSLSIFFGVTFLSNLAFPFFELHLVPAMAPINAMVLLAGGLYILFFLPPQSITSDVVYGLIVSKVKEFLFFADGNGNIYAANQYALTNLKYNNYDIARNNPEILFSEPAKVEEAIKTTNYRKVSRQIRIDLITRTGERIPVMLYVIKVSDLLKRTQGYVLSCMDYRQKLKLRDEVSDRVRTEKNLSQLRKELEILVKKRTRELQEANIRLQQEVLDRRSAEEQIKADLQEKVKLVQEIHHRVKNNIQVIISLVNMLCSHPKIDSHAAEKLRDIAEKARYISRIHEDFYSSPNLSSIPFSRYLKKTVGELYGHYGRHKDIVFKLNISNEMLDISEAIPLGIIFNELLMNSMIHAFEKEMKPDERCTINIEFYRNIDNYSLVVSDNGRGLPGPYHEIKNTKTGIQLVNVLVKDHLKGKLTHYSQKGTTFIINF